MLSNRLAFVAVALACVAAAAGGSYVATRHNMADHASASLDAASAPTTTTAAPSAGTQPAAPQASPAPAPSAAPVATEPDRPAARPSPAPSARTADTARPSAPSARPARPSSSAASPVASRVDEPAAPADRAPQPSTGGAAAPAEPPLTARAEEPRPVEPVRAPEPEPAFEELTVPADSVLGLRTETALSSERARVEDRVEARVVRDVRIGGRVAVPAGAKATGSVVVVERGGKMRDRARLGIRFHTLTMPDGTKLPITTETIYRYGDAPGNDSAKKIGGGAVAGAILGAIIGGGKGAAIGATTGAAGGGAMVMTGDRSEAVFPSGADVTARILAPITVTVDR